MTDDKTTSFLDGEPVRLREWNADVIHRLPQPPFTSAIIGAADTASIQVIDPTRRVAPEHAMIERWGEGWAMRELAGELRADGVRRRAVMLTPGLEIVIGGIKLVAEGRRFIGARALVARMLGWGSPAIDRAMRALRLAAHGLEPLALCGPGNMVAIAEALHSSALGAGAPFVVCDPRRRDVPGDVRSARNVATGTEALREANGGSICVWSRRLPEDFADLERALRDPGVRVQLIVCSEPRGEKPYHVDPIVIPPLSSRPADDIVRIIDEYADEEAAILAPCVQINAADRDWIRRTMAATIPDIQKAVQRLLALRSNPWSWADAARVLGMAGISLARWCQRSGAPVIVGNVDARVEAWSAAR